MEEKKRLDPEIRREVLKQALKLLYDCEKVDGRLFDLDKFERYEELVRVVKETFPEKDGYFITCDDPGDRIYRHAIIVTVRHDDVIIIHPMEVDKSNFIKIIMLSDSIIFAKSDDMMVLEIYDIWSDEKEVLAAED